MTRLLRKNNQPHSQEKQERTVEGKREQKNQSEEISEQSEDTEQKWQPVQAGTESHGQSPCSVMHREPTLHLALCQELGTTVRKTKRTFPNSTITVLRRKKES
jgi:TATA-binding protein-associated factor Taf7